jgi:hypothetical protein
VSGGLIAWDFDTREHYERFCDRSREWGLAVLVLRLANGYLSRTPTGGHHLPAYLDEPPGSTKLAMRPDPTADDPRRRKTLIELKGEGGYLVEAPSCGPVHPSGEPYVRLKGSVETIETVSAEEFEALCALARSFDECEAETVREPASPGKGWELRPGDEYGAKAGWEDILVGWTKVYEEGEATYWRRPGKSHGISASTNYGGRGVLRVFSSSTDFAVDRNYTKFGAFTALRHGGDFKAAAKALEAEGYGRRAEGPAAEPPEWEPLGSRELPPVPPFPIAAFPERLAAFLAEAARVVQAPVDYFAVVALGLLGAAIGMSVNLRVKHTWEEAPNLYIALVAPPGSKKSPVLKLLAAALYRIDRVLRERYEREREAYERALEETRKGEGPRPREPVPGHLTLDDATRESVAQIHAENPRGLALVLDELAGWFLSFDAYRNGKGSDRQFWMSLNTGSLVKVTRKGSREPVIVRRPCVSVVGAITPAKLRGLAQGEDDGWSDRILFSFPDDFSGDESWSDEEVSAEALSDWEAVVDRLWSRETVPDEADGRPRPFFVGFTEGGRAAWAAWVNAHRREKASLRSEAPHLVGPWSKFEGFMARVVLILGQASQAESAHRGSLPRNVDEGDVKRAASVVDYFKAHLRRVSAFLNPGGSPLPAGAKAILRWITRHEVQAFSDVAHDFSKSLDKEEREAAVRKLEEKGYVRRVPADKSPGKAGPKPAARYETNPYLFQPNQPNGPNHPAYDAGDGGDN